MPDKVIPADVREFIMINIDSVAQLEGLLLLRANHAQQHRAQNIADRLYIPASEAENLMDRLVERGLIAKDPESGTYSYKTDPATRESIDKLADIYAHYLLPVTHFIHSKSKSRIQKFADAFRIRKE
jgi:hypothetical protein